MASENPIGYARLHEDREQVLVDRLSSVDLVGLPRYTHSGLTRTYEADLQMRFAGRDVTQDPATGADFYQHESYDADRFYGPRRDRGITDRTRP